MNTSAEVLNEFLSRHVNHIPDLTNKSIEETGLLNEVSSHFELTQFHDLYDTLLYSRLIGEAIERHPHPERIIDFGAGSSLPTLVALSKINSEIPVTAVDVDPEALKISCENAENFHLSHRYDFVQSKMEDFDLKDPNTIIVSNPPYIPAPQEAHDYRFLPVNGGEDGTKYLLRFLERDYPENTLLALFWGSLTNPSRIIPMINERFEVLYVNAARVHFGEYTSCPVIKGHLEKLLDEGRVAYEKDPEKGEVQIVLGTILRPIRKS